MRLGDRAWAITTVIEAADVLTQTAEARLTAQLDLSLAEKEVLFRLTLAGGPLRMKDLARALLFSPGGATRVVDRMSQRGLVDRSRTGEDRRATVVRLTRAGRRALADSAPIMESVVRDVLDPFVTSDEVATITRILAKVVEGNGRWRNRQAGEDYETAIRSVG